MPPRARKPTKKEDPPSERDDDDYSSDGEPEEASEDYEPKEKKRKAPAAAKPSKPAKKPAAASAAGGGGAAGAGGSASPPPAAKSPGGHRKAHVARADPGVEPKGREYEPATGYWLDPSLPLMWTKVSAAGKIGADAPDPPARAKVAAFDLDGTLVNVKNTGAGRSYPLNEEDWVLFNDRVPATVRRYHLQGYEIVIISNQGGVQKKLAGRMAQMVKARSAAVAVSLGVPCRVLLCPSRDPCPFRKPETGMWDFFERELRRGAGGGGAGAGAGEDDEEEKAPAPPIVSRRESVFVGDAAGRAEDHNGKGADSDRAFAEALGIPFLTPEEAFGQIKGKAPISAEKWKAGVEAVKAAKEGNDEAAGVNGALIGALSGLADKIFAMVKECPEKLPGDDATRWRFKAQAYSAAAKSIAGAFTDKITLKNLSQVGKLPKVGKSTLEKLKECLQNGKIALMEELEGYEAGGAAAAAAVPAHVAQQQQAAAAFM
jgi:DNA 3'-phosphatase